MKESDEMAKRTTGRSSTRRKLPTFDVYEQEDGALVVLGAGDVPEEDVDPVWTGEAEDERDAIRQARKSDRALRNAPAAESAHDPDLPDDHRRSVEEATNRRLGITTKRPATKRGGRTKSAAKSGARKGAAKRSVKKTTRTQTGSRKK